MEENHYFEDFKPIRNKLRELNLFDSLEVLRQYALIQNSDPLKRSLPNIEQGKINYIMPNEVDFLLVNSMIYSSELPCSKKLSQVLTRGRILSLVKVIEDKIDSNGMNQDVWLWLNSYLHNQWKQKSGHIFEQIYRYYTIFSQDKMSEHIESVLGISYKMFVICAFWLYARFSDKWKESKQFLLSIEDDASPFYYQNMQKTISILSLPLYKLREMLKASVRYDHNIFNYHNSPHLVYPIMDYGEYLYCPVPQYLLKQLTAGIYYIADIPNANLQNSFGNGFEKYVGEILQCYNKSRFNIIPEIAYKKKQNKNKSSDWIVVDQNAIIFIECKTKRLRCESKELLSITNELEKDIQDISNGVFQLYKVYEDYKSNKISELVYNSDFIFIPILITLEDWFAGLPSFDEKISSNVREKLILEKIDLEAFDKFKYKIISVSSFERDFQIMASEGIGNYFKLGKEGRFDESYLQGFKFENHFVDRFERDFILPYQ
jgi:hypothetical protein